MATLNDLIILFINIYNWYTDSQTSKQTCIFTIRKCALNTSFHLDLTLLWLKPLGTQIGDKTIKGMGQAHDNIRSVVYCAPKTVLEFHYVIFGVSNCVASIIVSSPLTPSGKHIDCG